jgi:hypothetical protein
VVDCVAGGEEGAEDGSFGFEDLAVFDGELTGAGLVFVNSGGEAWIVGDEVGDASGVVAVPVGKEDVGNFEVSFFQEFGYICCPDGDTLWLERVRKCFDDFEEWTYLASINENSRLSSPDEVCVGSLQLHLPRIPSHNANDAARDAFDVCKGRKTRLLCGEVIFPDTEVEGNRIARHSVRVTPARNKCKEAYGLFRSLLYIKQKNSIRETWYSVVLDTDPGDMARPQTAEARIPTSRTIQQ